MFEAIVRSAARLCEARLPPISPERERSYTSFLGTPTGRGGASTRHPVDPRQFGAGRAVLDRPAVHIPDALWADPEYDRKGAVG